LEINYCDNLNFTLPQAGIVVIGPNGAGKSTIFKMIMEASQIQVNFLLVIP
jgi:ABC-type Mn2+/Zn2+ transport system ATPase subunit